MVESYKAGQLYDFELPGCGDDTKKITRSLQTRMRWIWEEDLEQEVLDAKAFYHMAAKQ